MWSSVVDELVDRLIPDGGKGLLGKGKHCHECEGRGYTRKSQSIWQVCPNCYAGRCWTPVAENYPQVCMELKWFNFPRGGAFSLPTEWWIEAGMDRFARGEDLSYSGRTQLTSELYPLTAIEPPHMGQRLRRGHGGFTQDRMMSVLRDIALRREIWPIEIIEGASGDYHYRVHQGAHRFHASVAAGFSHIPGIILVRY
jgi:hypothetical protein